ncbi:MAG TPA: nuclear transport factor 2 family protein [Croceicoccus sp.]|nr:nuclear transport factor 2 family protein [Croceicoccus sp.]
MTDTSEASAKAHAHHLFQDIYYGHVDKGDMTTAVSALHPDVEWSHAQVWAHHGFARGEPSAHKGRDAVYGLLSARVDELKDAGITHHVRDMVMEGNKGAFIGAVEGPGPDRLFMVWFEIEDDLVKRYDLRPL